jgi:hypothetical protein
MRVWLQNEATTLFAIKDSREVGFTAAEVAGKVGRGLGGQQHAHVYLPLLGRFPMTGCAVV